MPVQLAAARVVSRRWLGLVEVPPELEKALTDCNAELGGERGRQLRHGRKGSHICAGKALWRMQGHAQLSNKCSKAETAVYDRQAGAGVQAQRHSADRHAAP